MYNAKVAVNNSKSNETFSTTMYRFFKEIKYIITTTNIEPNFYYQLIINTLYIKELFNITK